MLIRKKNYLALQQQLADVLMKLARLEEALALVPVDRIEQGDLWLPSSSTINKLKLSKTINGEQLK